MQIPYRVAHTVCGTCYTVRIGCRKRITIQEITILHQRDGGHILPCISYLLLQTMTRNNRTGISGVILPNKETRRYRVTASNQRVMEFIIRHDLNPYANNTVTTVNRSQSLFCIYGVRFKRMLFLQDQIMFIHHIVLRQHTDQCPVIFSAPFIR